MGYSTLCSVCFHQIKLQPFSGTSIFIQKRFRYYWEKRAMCRDKIRLLMITVPKLQKQKPVFNQTNVEEKLYGLDVILHQEVKQIFENSRMICVCLYADQQSDDYYHVRYELQQNDMNMEQYDDHVMKYALKGTRHENMLTLFDGPTTIIHGEPNVKQMIHAVKKNKYLLLIGGMIDGKMMTLDQLTEYSLHPGLDHARGELSGILSTATSSTFHLLNSPTSQLTLLLNQYIQDGTTSGDTSEPC